MRRFRAVLFAAWTVLAPALRCAVPPEKAAHLESDLTPVGAERKCSDDETIPEWTGGLVQPPDGYQPGSRYADPFPDDKPRFTITARNSAAYRDHLTAGQIALLETYPDYEIPVYPTRRSAALPRFVYSAIRANATQARLAPDGGSVLNAFVGVPFPLPQNGAEVIWNHLLRYRGESIERSVDRAAVSEDGNYTLRSSREAWLYPYAQLRSSRGEIGSVISLFKETVTAPPRLTGDIRLVDDSLDPARWPRHEWLFQTGQRRARRVPASAYDQSDPASPGACTSDERDLFNGGLDRYDWKLLGKREVFVPYNAYCLHEARVKYAELLSPHHLNPDLLRYELHRVWVVEAALKPGFRHLYPRRTFYVDEDSWQILCADAYDAAGKVWRVAEAHGINYYDVPAFWGSIEVHLDLVSGRYVVAGLASGQPPPHFNTGLTARDFTVGSLRAASATVEDEP